MDEPLEKRVSTVGKVHPHTEVRFALMGLFPPQISRVWFLKTNQLHV